MQPSADAGLLAGAAVRITKAHAQEAAAELLCASGGGGPAPLGPSSVAELRALLCGTLVDKWLLPFLTIVALGATTTQNGSKTAAARAAAGHVAMVVASRAAVGDGARRLPPAALRLAAWQKRRQLHKDDAEAAKNVVAMAAELASVRTAGPRPPWTLPS